MLDDQAVERLMADLELPDRGRELVRHARSKSPVRQVRSTLSNSVISQYSQKMGGRHLELESRTVESAAATIYETDAACLEYWPQPFQAELILCDTDGRRIGRTRHIPDFMIITKTRILVVEWREESRLIKYSLKGKQYSKDENGRWHYRAAEEYFGGTGLTYELHSANELSRNYVLNARFLEEYRSDRAPKLDLAVSRTLSELLIAHGAIPFVELIQKHGFTADQIFLGLTSGIGAVDLNADRLDATADLIIFRDASLCRVHHIIHARGEESLPLPSVAKLTQGTSLNIGSQAYTVISTCENGITLQDSRGELSFLSMEHVDALHQSQDITSIVNPKGEQSQIRYVSQLSQEQLERALARYHALGGSGRSARRWRKRVAGLSTLAEKLIALSDRIDERGNRTCRISSLSLEAADRCVQRLYNTKEGRTAFAVWEVYENECLQQNIDAMSYATFCNRLKDTGSIEIREGKRKAYQVNPIPLVFDYRFPVDGVRPHEVCYIDHTIWSIATISPGGLDLGKPTLTLATDGHVTKMRAFYLSYDPPSAAVVLMVLRDYCRRNGRLPTPLAKRLYWLEGTMSHMGTVFTLQSLTAEKPLSAPVRTGKHQSIS
ncbi:hypothetical protein ACFPL7_13960 [Dongia soli]|uniref:Uncharacterized protein n=1 Tax=Dongia soli TaxID=600628 RepID=A0ABU5EEN0_9PROT|nr:hypothetical protein [Dongia soli]MDY0884000.1 hypothetical protein [Dongia soli]